MSKNQQFKWQKTKVIKLIEILWYTYNKKNIWVLTFGLWILTQNIIRVSWLTEWNCFSKTNWQMRKSKFTSYQSQLLRLVPTDNPKSLTRPWSSIINDCDCITLLDGILQSYSIIKTVWTFLINGVILCMKS